MIPPAKKEMKTKCKEYPPVFSLVNMHICCSLFFWQNATEQNLKKKSHNRKKKNHTRHTLATSSPAKLYYPLFVSKKNSLYPFLIISLL